MDENSNYERPVPTHKISFWGVRCYINDETGDLWGINKFHEALIPWAVHFHNAMSFISEMLCPDYIGPGFRFKILEIYIYQND